VDPFRSSSLLSAGRGILTRTDPPFTRLISLRRPAASVPRKKSRYGLIRPTVANRLSSRDSMPCVCREISRSRVGPGAHRTEARVARPGR